MIKIYLCAKDPYAEKYQLLINKRENIGLKYFNDSKSFIEYSNDMDNIYKNIEEYNPNKKQKKILTIFYDLIADILSNKILNPIVTELLIRARKLNIYLVFITLILISLVLIIKFEISGSFNKFHLIIHQVLTLETL